MWRSLIIAVLLAAFTCSGTSLASGALPIDPFVQQGARLVGGAQDGAPELGASVAVSADGDTALVGGPADGGVGAVWVFTRSGSTWTQQGAKLTARGETGNGEFGASVALSADGNTALIGGRGDDGRVGAVWVFTRSGSTWTQQGEKLVGSGESGPASFGESVALSADGNIALVGGSGDNNTTGAVWVFTRSGSTWTQQGEKLTGGGGCGTPFFGRSVALSANGEIALIGGAVDCDIGAAWVFTRSGSTWTQQGPKLTGKGEVGKGWFGESVALSCEGNTALVGGFADDKDLGAAWVFTRSGSTWTQQGEKLVGTGERGEGFLGRTVALSCDGSTALVGGPGDTSGVGAAWAFTHSGSTWTQLGEKLTGSGESGEGHHSVLGGEFGDSVALSSDGGTALVGGEQNAGLAGAAWAFVNQPASPPDPAQYGRCESVARVSGVRVTGLYANANCTQRGTHTIYEWLPGVVRPHFTSAIREGAASFATVNGWKMTCKGETGSGEYSGSGLTTVGGVALTFTACERSGQRCSSAGVAEGDIVTSELEGMLGVTRLGETAGENKVGLQLYPLGHTGAVMEFSCGATPVSIRGSLIAAITANRMQLKGKLIYSALKGRQQPESFAGGPRAVLEASVGGGAFEQLGLALKATQTNEEKLEASSFAGLQQAPLARTRKARRRTGPAGKPQRRGRRG